MRARDRGLVYGTTEGVNGVPLSGHILFQKRLLSRHHLGLQCATAHYCSVGAVDLADLDMPLGDWTEEFKLVL